MLKLYTYFRSSAAFRVRIALHYKGLPYQAIPVHLLRGGGEQHSAAFADRNPARLIPVLEDGAFTLAQSLAIIEYLEETQPTPALLPGDAAARAGVRALALSIACDIHPLNNTRVLRYLKEPLEIDEQRRAEWSRHWIALGFTALERVLAQGGTARACCYGDTPTLADCCLIPQVFNAQRVNCPLEPFPTIWRIYQHCMRLEAFARAAPGAQGDAE
ncbi:MAG TPA: maleylacetoacetate isomerase [Steroidobacteraceae bacterium]|nr:maleylacetoacetate isomerase [Steroidobacteraceae bacterium]